MSEMTVRLPGHVTAVDADGGVPRRPGLPGEAVADLLNAIGHLLMYLSGHGGHGRWTYDTEEQVFACCCGRASWKLGDPLPGVTP